VVNTQRAEYGLCVVTTLGKLRVGGDVIHGFLLVRALENFEHDFLFFATFKNVYMDSGKVRQDFLFLAALGCVVDPY
jgi:hypothetical protein